MTTAVLLWYDGSHRGYVSYEPKKRNHTMMQIAPRIVLDERIQAGKPVISGTRVPVEVVLGVLAAGEPMERIMSEYRIQREDILAAIAYAASVVSGEDIRE